MAKPIVWCDVPVMKLNGVIALDGERRGRR